MAIQSSTIRIYGDSAKGTLIKTVTTTSSSQEIPISDLNPGVEYYATAQVVDQYGLTSAESPVYQFYTIPNPVWAGQSPISDGHTTIDYQINIESTDVTEDYCGIAYSTDPLMATYTLYHEVRGEGTLTGLDENTTYYFAPYVVDELGRQWINFDVERSRTTGYNNPTIAWVGNPTMTSTSFTQDITVTSTDTVSALTCYFKTSSAGSYTSVPLTAGTGTITVSLSSLIPNTTYNIYVTATNSAGTGTSSTINVTTSAAGISLSPSVTSISNTTNDTVFSDTITKDNNVTITAHELRAYTTSDHSTAAVETLQQATPATTYSDTFTSLDPQTTYYLFAYAEYTVTGDATTYSIYSSPVSVNTYTLASFGVISADNDTLYIPYSVSGQATSIEMGYSTNGAAWTSIPVSSLTGGTIELGGLTPGTTYMLRVRAQNTTAGWSGYNQRTVATTAVAQTVTITTIDNITPESCDITITVE